MKKFLAIFAFCLLIFAFFPAPARAVGICPDPIEEDPAGNCCNWGDKNTNPTHIRVGDPGCNEETGWICSKDTIPGSQKPFGPCQYCSNTVCKYGPGCEQTCNWACCPAAPPDGEDEVNCRMDDTNLIACCPIVRGAPSGFLDIIRDLIEKAISILIPVSLTVEDFQASEKFEEATDYYYGSEHSPFEEGVFFRLAPPNLLEEYFPSEGDEVETRNEWAKWDMELDGTSGGSGGNKAVNDGKLKHVEPYRLAVENLRNFLVAIPKTEDNPTSQKTPETKVAKSNLNAFVLAAVTPTPTPPPADNLCQPPIVEAETKKTCTPSNVPEDRNVSPTDLLNMVTGNFELFTKIVDLDILGHDSAGVDTDPDGAAAQDPHYEDGGFLEIFKLPGEEYETRNAEGKADGLRLNVGPVIALGVTVFPKVSIPLGQEELELSYQGSDTHEREKENGVFDKLTPPTTEDSTTSLQTPSEPAIYLASNLSVQGAYQYKPPTSFAERLGQTLGSWLAKIITL